MVPNRIYSIVAAKCDGAVVTPVRSKENGTADREALAEILPQLKQLNPSIVIETKDLYLPDAEMTEKMMPWLTDDRVFGHMYSGTVETFLDHEKVQAAKKAFEDASGLILV